MKRFPLHLVPVAFLFLACDTKGETPPLGSVGITTSAPTVEQGFTTTDGWSVKYTRFLVNISALNIAGTDQVVTASATSQIVDYAAPPTPKSLLAMTNRVARAWQDVNLEIAPATAESALLDPATAADHDVMAGGGLSIYVEGTITKGTVVKSLKWGFTTDTKYTGCAGRLNGALTPGLVVPANGGDTANVALTGDVLFFDNVTTHGHTLRADPIASADKDNDGTVTLEELTGVTLEDARMTTGLYQASVPSVDSLGAFVTEQARSLVASFRDEGHCAIEPVGSAP